MKNVWEVCEFSEEITSGNLEISKFAVELYSVLDGTADRNYLDPKTFLDNTYLTDAMEIALKDSLLRLVKNQGKPVDLLDVSFGGGKTHSVVLLYHVFRNREIGTRFIQETGIAEKYGIGEIPDIDVVAIDGRQIKKNTLWGEIADRFGKFEEFRAMDENKTPPMDVSKIKSLFSKPTLLMLDEIPLYLVKVKAESPEMVNSHLAFLHELASVASSTDNVRLVITTTAEQRLLSDVSDRVKGITSLDAFGVAAGIKEAVSRSADPLVPVKEKDAYGVIRQRLVKKIDADERDRIVDEYYRYYRENNLVTDEDYKEKMLAAYPFHPFFIETLYSRVGTIQDFNKTRGMFRLLGLVLHYICKAKTPCSLVDTGHLRLEEQPIMDDLTSKIHMDFQPIIQSDCIDKARRLDQNRREKMVERISNTIYLYSLISTVGKMSGIHASDLKLALGRPGLDVGLIERALYEDIENEFWFIKNRNGEFYFDGEPNINKIIDQYKTDVSNDKLRNTIFATLESLVTPRTGIKPVFWNRDELGESDIIRIFVDDYKEPVTDEAAKNKMNGILTEKPGGEIRIKQNTLVMLYADPNGIDMLKDRARTVAGIVAAGNDERIKIDRENAKILKSRLDTARGELDAACIQAYSRIAYPRNADVRLDQISAMESKENDLTSMVIDRLARQGKMMNPKDSLNHDIIKLDDTCIISGILDRFKSDKSKHFILENQQIFDAVRDGIRNGAFGYAESLEDKDGKYVGVIGKDVPVSWSGHLIPKDLVMSRTEPAPVAPGPSPEPDGKSEGRQTPIGFECRIKVKDVGQTLEVLDKLSIECIETNMTKKLEITLSAKDTSVTISTGLERQPDVKSLLKMLRSKEYEGGGFLIICSNTDLRNVFEEWGVEVEVV